MKILARTFIGVKDAFLHTYGDKNEEDGELQGYTKKMQDKANDGYKHFDSYHKKDSDKYGYEVHSEFGHANKAGVDTTGANGKYSDEEKGEKVLVIFIIRRCSVKHDIMVIRVLGDFFETFYS